MEVSIEGKTSLNSLVGIGSKIQLDGLEETIAVVSSERSIGQKLLGLDSSCSQMCQVPQRQTQNKVFSVQQQK